MLTHWRKPVTSLRRWAERLGLSRTSGAASQGSPQLFLSFILRHQPFVIHHESHFDLRHLTDAWHSFSWRLKTQEVVQFTLEVRYSNHCYTDAKLPNDPGCAIILDKSIKRIFCPSRHARSLSLPSLFSNLAARPTTSVGILRRNYSVFEVQQDGLLYYAFFKLRGLRASNSDNAHLNLFVESAYERPDKVISRRKVPFGMLAEAVVTNAKL